MTDDERKRYSTRSYLLLEEMTCPRTEVRYNVLSMSSRKILSRFNFAKFVAFAVSFARTLRVAACREIPTEETGVRKNKY